MGAPHSRHDHEAQLRDILARATDVGMITRDISRTGETRYVSIVVVLEGEITEVTNIVAAVVGLRSQLRDGRDVIRVRGAGISHAEQISDLLNRALFGADLAYVSLTGTYKIRSI